jgi:hypothetical protein
MHDSGIVGNRQGNRAHAASWSHGHAPNKHTKSQHQHGSGFVLAVALERNREKNVLARNEETIRLYEHLSNNKI